MYLSLSVRYLFRGCIIIAQRERARWGAGGGEEERDDDDDDDGRVCILVLIVLFEK